MTGMTSRAGTTTDVGSWTRTQLYAYGHSKLGYADSKPGSRAWNLDASILAKIMKARGITNAEFVLAVDYCAKNHKLIQRPAGVFAYLDRAKKAKRAEHLPTDVEQQITDAVVEERNAMRPEMNEWIGRLLRARGDYRWEVLAEWSKSWE
jgi:hypothetical protein